MSRRPEAGVILINVLVVLGLAATVVYAMLTLADLAIARSQAFSDAGQGLALIRGGEQSAIAALRRDLAEAPEADYPTETWGKIAQEKIGIPGGTFELQITDAQGLFNLNTLAETDLQSTQFLATIVEAVGLPEDDAARILASLALDGPLHRLEDLTTRVGIEPDDVRKLGALATALPGNGDVNINAAPQALLEVLLQNRVLASNLINRRQQIGYLTAKDLEATQVVLPPGTGYTSNLFWVRTTVRIGETVQSVDSLLSRRLGARGPEVIVVERRNALSAAVPPPPAT